MSELVDTILEKECANCGEIIEDGEEEVFRGETYCFDCYQELTAACDLCGKVVLQDELEWWGDNQICPECMDDRAPSFDGEANFEETKESYLAFKEQYLGRKTEDLPPGEHGFSDSITTDETDIRYYISVTVDEAGIITDISPLTAEILLSEGATSSKWAPYSIDDDDYEWFAEPIMEDIVVEEEDEEESGEDREED